MCLLPPMNIAMAWHVLVTVHISYTFFHILHISHTLQPVWSWSFCLAQFTCFFSFNSTSAGQLRQCNIHLERRHSCQPCCGPNHQVWLLIIELTWNCILNWTSLLVFCFPPYNLGRNARRDEIEEKGKEEM